MRGGYLLMYLHSGLVFIFIHNPHDSQSNMHSGYLPPYLHISLVHILGSKTFPICVVDIYHSICIVDWCLFSSTILMIPNPICILDIFHCNDMLISCIYSVAIPVDYAFYHICTVVWCIFWDARPFQYAWWISATVFA